MIFDEISPILGKKECELQRKLGGTQIHNLAGGVQLYGHVVPPKTGIPPNITPPKTKFPLKGLKSPKWQLGGLQLGRGSWCAFV